MMEYFVTYYQIDSPSCGYIEGSNRPSENCFKSIGCWMATNDGTLDRNVCNRSRMKSGCPSFADCRGSLPYKCITDPCPKSIQIPLCRASIGGLDEKGKGIFDKESPVRSKPNFSLDSREDLCLSDLTEERQHHKLTRTYAAMVGNSCGRVLCTDPHYIQSLKECVLLATDIRRFLKPPTPNQSTNTSPSVPSSPTNVQSTIPPATSEQLEERAVTLVKPVCEDDRKVAPTPTQAEKPVKLRNMPSLEELARTLSFPENEQEDVEWILATHVATNAAETLKNARVKSDKKVFEDECFPIEIRGFQLGRDKQRRIWWKSEEGSQAVFYLRSSLPNVTLQQPKKKKRKK